MKTSSIIGLALAGAAMTTGGLVGRRLLVDRRLAAREARLHLPPPRATFDMAMVADLPAPARRYFRHAIAPGTPLARTVEIVQRGSMLPTPGGARVDLAAHEVLTPERGFLWRARLRMGPIPVRVVDFYLDDDGEVNVELFGAVPMQSASGPDVARSARGRTLGEALWVPSALLPRPGVTWDAVDDHHARVTLTLDGEAIPLTLEVDDDGRLRTLTMRRYGNVGVPDWQPIPYGFTVERETAFGGYTIPSRICGGWWFGTARYDPAAASTFEVLDATYS